MREGRITVGADGDWCGRGPSLWQWDLARGMCPFRRKFFNFLNESGVFWCTLEHSFKVNVPATEASKVAPDVHALCL